MINLQHQPLLFLRRQVLLRALCCCLVLLTLQPAENPLFVAIQSLLCQGEPPNSEDDGEVESTAKAVLPSSPRCLQRAHRRARPRPMGPVTKASPSSRFLFPDRRAGRRALALRSGAGSNQRC
jgi:hypothetical protein